MLNDFTNKPVVHLNTLADLSRRTDEQVKNKPAIHAFANLDGLIRGVSAMRHDDEQIDVGISRGLDPCVRAKENDPPRVKFARDRRAKGPDVSHCYHIRFTIGKSGYAR